MEKRREKKSKNVIILQNSNTNIQLSENIYPIANIIIICSRCNAALRQLKALNKKASSPVSIAKLSK